MAGRAQRDGYGDGVHTYWRPVWPVLADDLRPAAGPRPPRVPGGKTDVRDRALPFSRDVSQPVTRWSRSPCAILAS